MTHSPRRSEGLWYFGDLADQPDHPLAEAEPICSCTDVDGWLMPSGRSQEVSWVLFSCLSTLVQVVCKHPYLVRLGWFPLVGESELILCWCCLIHKLSYVVLLSTYFFLLGLSLCLNTTFCCKFSLTHRYHTLWRRKRKKLSSTGYIAEAKYIVYNFTFQRPSLKSY